MEKKFLTSRGKNMHLTLVPLCTVFLCLISCTSGGASPKQSHSLDVYAVREAGSRLRVMWFLQEGNLTFIANFRLTLTSSTGNKLLDIRLPHYKRSKGIKGICADASYTITVKALETQGLPIAQKEVRVNPTTPGTDGDKRIFFVANEIRPKQARLAWALINVDAHRLKYIRIHIEREGRNGPQVITRSLPTYKRTFLFSRIPYKSYFCVSLEALDNNSQPFINSALYFETPEYGRYTQPVNGSALPLDTLLNECCNQCRFPPLLFDPN